MSESRSSRTINQLHALLDEKLAPTSTLHGVLVDVFGIGLLLIGKSGIGKSECAVELVLRGHRLVADDVVRCEWRPPGMVFGSAADMLRHHVEVRGLGVLNIKDLFGVTAVRERKRIDLVVQLEEWSEKKEYDRLGVDDQHFTILNTNVRSVTVPVRPGRDMGAMLEMAARNEILRRAGKHSAKELVARLEENAGSRARWRSTINRRASSARRSRRGRSRRLRLRTRASRTRTGVVGRTPSAPSRP
jgi:HPr kinase/phosphorylase